MRAVWEEKPCNARSNAAGMLHDSWKACRMGPPKGKIDFYLQPMIDVPGRVQRYLSYFPQVALPGSLSVPP